MTDRLRQLERYYEVLDRLIAPALQAAGDELLILVASAGRISGTGDGLVALAGTAANSRVKDGAANAVDIAPTVLHALGVPLSRQLAGRALVELFAVDAVRRWPVRHVDSYGPPVEPAAVRQGQPLDQEMIDRLRSLGYVR
jgi:arylsulfatase A-like enzyme